MAGLLFLLSLGVVLGKHDKHDKQESAALQPVDQKASHTVKVLAAGQGDTANQWLYHTLCSAGFKTWHTSVTCEPETANSCAEDCRRVSNAPAVKNFNATFANLLTNHGLSRMSSAADMRYVGATRVVRRLK
jgi:hypothetical protein